MAAELMRLTVTRKGETPQAYVVKPSVIVAFEREFNVGLGALKDAGRMEYVYWLAWECERRSGKIVKPFLGWLDEVENVDAGDEDAPLASGATPSPEG